MQGSKRLMQKDLYHFLPQNRHQTESEEYHSQVKTREGNSGWIPGEIKIKV